jgi:cadmium resistance protein CadD (predicted permease)
MPAVDVLKVAGVAAGAFVATNLDDILVLTVLFGESKVCSSDI